MSRIETRESVVIFVYQTSFRSEPALDQLKLFMEDEANSHIEGDKDFFCTLALGVLDNRAAIDEKISSFLKKWTIERIPVLDRAILEVAFYEIENIDDVPVSVSINEAVRLSKKYGTADSFSYINGVLSAFEKSL